MLLTLCSFYVKATEFQEAESMLRDKPRKAISLINKALQEAKGSKEKRAEWLILKASAYNELKAIDSIPKCIWLASKYLKKDANWRLKEKGFGTIAQAYESLFITDSAIFYYENGLALVEGKHPSREVYYLDKLSYIHTVNGSNPKAVEYCIQGIRTADHHQLRDYSAIFNNRMGNIYAEQGDFDRALSSYNRALGKYADLNQPLGQARSMLNIGLSYLSLENYVLAESNFKSALDIFTEINDSKGLADVFESLGELEFIQKNIREALDFQKRALTIRLQNKLYLDVSKSYVSLANYYLSTKRYDDALVATRSGLSIARKTGTDLLLLDLYKQFYLIYKDLNYKDSALVYHEKYTQIKEQIDKVNNDALVIRLQNTFETERRQLELAEMRKVNSLLDEKLQNSQRINDQDQLLKILFSSIITILLIVAILFYSRYRLKSIANILISRKVKENELLLQELHHRVKNNLQFISSLLSLQMHKIRDNDSKTLIHESVQKVRAMSLVHNQLNFNAQSDPDISFNTFIEKLTNSLILSLGLDQDQLKLNYRWKKVKFDMDSYNAIGLVINEMITNSFKHCDTDTLEIKIAFLENDQSRGIRYEDNGPGLEENYFTEEKQMGITLMKLLVEDLGGSLRYVKPKPDEHGIRIHINLRKISKHGR